jgi:hypothetical protein
LPKPPRFESAALSNKAGVLSSPTAGGAHDQCGTLIYTATAGAQGTLAGLVGTALRFEPPDDWTPGAGLETRRGYRAGEEDSNPRNFSKRSNGVRKYRPFGVGRNVGRLVGWLILCDQQAAPQWLQLIQPFSGCRCER